MEIANIIITAVYLLAALIMATLVVKTVLFFKFEKAWDPVGFFYFPKPAIKMTNIRHLKVWRERQNYLSKLFFILLLLLGTLTIFNVLIFS